MKVLMIRNLRVIFYSIMRQLESGMKVSFCVLNRKSIHYELIIGDTIQTSGLGGIYPKGILIGTISKIVTTNNSTDRYAVIQTAVDFSKVYSVLVIKK